MTIQDIQDIVISELEKFGALDRSKDLESFNYTDSGHVDSLATMKFIVLLETRFNFRFQDDELLDKNFKTVGGLTQIIGKKLGCAKQ